MWAMEGAAGLGAPLTRQLAADGAEVIDVPAKLAARVRLLSTRHGRKTDEADAVSVGIAALTGCTLNTAAVEPTSSRCGRWSNTVTTWSKPAPKPSTGSMCY